MNERRLLKITDIDLQRGVVHIRLGKGHKDRYVTFSKFHVKKLPLYLGQVQRKDSKIVIIKIACKLLSRIRYVLINQQPYEMDLVK